MFLLEIWGFCLEKKIYHFVFYSIKLICEGIIVVLYDNESEISPAICSLCYITLKEQ